MPQKPISIVCICRNNPAELVLTLASIEALDSAFIETIVVDGSDTEECIDAVVNSRFDVDKYIYELDTGKYNAMNKGIRNSTGCGVIIINSGDMAVSEGIENVIYSELRDKLDSHIIYGGVVHVIGDNQFYVPPSAVDRRKIDAGVLPSHQSTIIPRSFYEKNIYDESMNIAADTKLMRAAFYELCHIKIDCALAKFSFGGVSSMPGSWASVRQHYGEMISARKLNKPDKIMLCCHLVLRKIFADLFGRSVLLKMQATLAEMRNKEVTNMRK